MQDADKLLMNKYVYVCVMHVNQNSFYLVLMNAIRVTE